MVGGAQITTHGIIHPQQDLGDEGSHVGQHRISFHTSLVCDCLHDLKDNPWLCLGLDIQVFPLARWEI